jgi:hypothetical protein
VKSKGLVETVGADADKGPIGGEAGGVEVSQKIRPIAIAANAVAVSAGSQRRALRPEGALGSGAGFAALTRRSRSGEGAFSGSAFMILSNSSTFIPPVGA